MADNTVNPNRIAFSSAGATRRRPSTPQYPQGVELTHLQLIQALAAVMPHRIVSAATDEDDVQETADHLRDIFQALGTYVNAVVDELADRVPGGIDRVYVSNMISDTASDIVGYLRHVVDRFDPKPSCSFFIKVASETAR
jgi:hypothetical protein